MLHAERLGGLTSLFFTVEEFLVALWPATTAQHLDGLVVVCARRGLRLHDLLLGWRLQWFRLLNVRHSQLLSGRRVLLQVLLELIVLLICRRRLLVEKKRSARPLGCLHLLTVLLVAIVEL